MHEGNRTVDGRFELREPLGRGGMGTVWRAYDLALHREVALKEVLADDSARSHRERVLREARALARITHPHVVAIHHIVDTPDEPHPWIVMELVRGGSLSDRLAAGPMTPPQAAQLGRGILAALRAAHSVGVLHRDVKPANVLLRENGAPVLTDFGIASMSGSTGITTTGSIVGSLDYVAPERLSGDEGNPASDLWSLGVLLFTAVEGYQPMRRDTDVATLAAVVKGEIPPTQRAGSLTPVIRALLAVDPAARPTAEQLDWMLTAAAGGTPTASAPHRAPVAPPPPGGPVARHKPKRSMWVPVIVAVAGALAALLVGVLAVQLLPSDPEDTDVPRADPPTVTIPQSGLVAPTGIRIPPTTTAPQESDLLTPAGARRAIGALEAASGTQDFTRATIYPGYFNAAAPNQGQPNVYDEYTYRNGKADRRPGGSTGDKKTVKLRTMNWDALPALFRTAEEKLGIPNPKSRYVVVEPAWVFHNNEPMLLVYLSDDYGGAYLAATADGTVTDVMPRK
mgnify:CR=1 FL=1